MTMKSAKANIRNSPLKSLLFGNLIFLLLGTNLVPAFAGLNRDKAAQYVRSFDFESLRLAITDLTETFGQKYPKGREYLEHLDSLKESSGIALGSFKQNHDSAKADMLKLAGELDKLRYDALLSNPLLDFEKLLLLKRKRGQLGLPVNHKCNSGIERTGYDNEIAVLGPVRPGGKLRTLFRPPAREFVGEIDLHYDAGKLLFTMPKGGSWQIFEIRTDGAGLRQVSPGEHPDVDNFDACYLPDGRIVFVSTASFTAVPCWHGKERACNIYLMDADGGNVRQLCFDQDLDLHPAVLPAGQVIFSRWDYTGPMHMYLRPLMAMNPDGTGQRAVYGSNSYWPNALYFPRGIPGAPGKIIAIIAGYHGVPRMGELGLIDTTKGWQGADGVVQRIPGRGKPVKTVIRDNLVDKSWPKFLHPYPLSDKYFLVASQRRHKGPWGIYLVDVFDNMLAIRDSRQGGSGSGRCCRLPGRCICRSGSRGRSSRHCKEAADSGLSLRLSGHGRAGQDWLRRAMGSDEDSRHRGCPQGRLGNVQRSGQYAAERPAAGRARQSGPVDAELVHGDAGRDRILCRLSRAAKANPRA
jgi:hypothetical protein